MRASFIEAPRTLAVASLNRAVPSQIVARCLHVIAGIGPQDGGPAYSVPRLVEALRLHHVDANLVSLWSTGEREQDQTVSFIERLPRSSIPPLAAVAWSRPLAARIRDAARVGAVLHTHGLWLAPNIYPALVRRRTAEVRLVHSPRGMLGAAALQISARKKYASWLLGQRWALQAADLIHATASAEAEEIRAAGLRNPIAVIPNGVDIPALSPRPLRSHDHQRTILSLGRIHPKKGLDRLVRAWALIADERPGWRLRLVGPSEVNFDMELAALAADLGAPNVEIAGPAYGPKKWEALRAADLFVLPTLNENFGISVAEALAAEVPVISTRGAPWQGLEREGCGWWINHGIEPLADTLRLATALLDTDRSIMGARGRAWMERDFGWDAIAERMAETYRWLREGGDPPSDIWIDKP